MARHREPLSSHHGALPSSAAMATQRNRDCDSGACPPLSHSGPGLGPVLKRLGGNRVRSTLRLAGARYWTSSVVPALVGTTLPFWLRPPGFSFRWSAALEFIVATVLVHSGFSFLLARFDHRPAAVWSRRSLGAGAATCLTAACLQGLHLDSGLRLHQGVPGYTFIVFGVLTLFAGMLYVAPPVRLARRVGGEVVLFEGLGLLPVLGAYLVQVGDLTRTAYLASLPIVVATALWVLTDEIVTRADDEREGRRTVALLVGPLLSGRVVAPMLVVALYGLLVAAVAVRESVSPVALVALVSLGLARKIVVLSWRAVADPAGMVQARASARTLHLVVGLVIALSSLFGVRG
jgi:1,4-dihydroxy-2-naphthoate octaprenyltransferase